MFSRLNATQGLAIALLGPLYLNGVFPEVTRGDQSPQPRSVTHVGVVCESTDADRSKPQDRKEPGQPNERQKVIYLDQGWNADERQDFYYLSQGSQLVPYYWFLALELPDSEELFRSDRHMASLGYVTQPPEDRRNPDGLPIGFVKDDNPATVETSYAIKRAFLGPNYRQENYPPDNAWLGLTCAACHTANLQHEDKIVRIDGGAALADHERFMAELVAALQATHTDDNKFTRFAKKVLDSGYNQEEAGELRKRLDAYTQVLEGLVKRNKGDHPYGFARLDAFGAILNQVCEAALEIDENHADANAPVSFPFLWDVPRLDWVQWNASAANPIERNVGEVLGVYAHAKLTGTPADGQFTSTARIDNLFHIEEELLTQLTAPEWPEDVFGPIDTAKAEEGSRLFAANCAGCHGVRDENGEFPAARTSDAAGRRLIRTVVLRHDVIGTDPQMALNFIRREVQPGALAPYLPESLRGQTKVHATVLLKIAVGGVIKNRLAGIRPPLDDGQRAALNGYRCPENRPPEPSGYKARPLNGIWATAPYLHNGSVPNLHELLTPAERRVKTFRLGNRQFDPIKVGYVDEGEFEFDTSLSGNSNAGHSGPGHTQTKDTDGNYHDYTIEERESLIEYLKTLR